MGEGRVMEAVIEDGGRGLLQAISGTDVMTEGRWDEYCVAECCQRVRVINCGGWERPRDRDQEIETMMAVACARYESTATDQPDYIQQTWKTYPPWIHALRRQR